MITEVEQDRIEGREKLTRKEMLQAEQAAYVKEKKERGEDNHSANDTSSEERIDECIPGLNWEQRRYLIQRLLTPRRKTKKAMDGRAILTAEEYESLFGVSRCAQATTMWILGVTNLSVIASAIGVHRTSLYRSGEFARFRCVMRGKVSLRYDDLGR